MLKKIIFLSFCFLLLNKNAGALNAIDKFILNHGVSACNGESRDCNDFYRQSVELNDWKAPISPEIRFE